MSSAQLNPQASEETGWREFLSAFQGTFTFEPGVSASQIREAERLLGSGLPSSIASLLAESNGIYWQEFHYHLTWSLAELIKVNLSARKDPNRGAFVDAVIFAGDGAGSSFFVKNFPGSQPVFTWYPTEDARVLVAPNIRDWARRWVTGALKT